MQKVLFKKTVSQIETKRVMFSEEWKVKKTIQYFLQISVFQYIFYIKINVRHQWLQILRKVPSEEIGIATLSTKS